MKPNEQFTGKWLVYVGKNVYKLTQRQYEDLNKLDAEGYRGRIVFEDFSIGVPFVQSTEKETYEGMGPNEKLLAMQKALTEWEEEQKLLK